MSTRFLISVALLWAAIGVVVAFLMRRRGHDFSVWLVLGVALGPLSVPLAIERARYHGSAEHQSRGVPTPPAAGFDVIVGIDGSSESTAALDSAVRLFGRSMSSLTLATVLDFDSQESVAGREAQSEGRALLAETARSVTFEPVETIVLFGRPAQTLKEHARTSGMELIVVGARGHGASEALFGSVTRKLVGGSEIPVFVGPTKSSKG